MIVELESRGAASTSLTSSFFTRSVQFLHLKAAQCPPSPRKVGHPIVASTKQKKKKARKPSSPTRAWSYEHFMVMWDEVFEHCCTDPVKAAHIRKLAHEGLARHGRGCVLVYQEVQTRPRGAGTGFTSKPPKSSRSVPDFVTLDYYAVYLPREFLLDPRKAPLDEDMAASDEKMHTSGNAGHVTVEKQGHDSNNIAGRQQNDGSGDRIIDIGDIVREAQNVYSFYSDDEDESDADMHEGENPLLLLDDADGDINPSDSQHIMGTDAEKVSAGHATNADDSLIILDDYDMHTTDSLIALDNDSRRVGTYGADGKEADSSLISNEIIDLTLNNDNVPNCADEPERLGNHAFMLSDNGEKADKANPFANKPLLREKWHEANFTGKAKVIHDECEELENGSNAAVHCTSANIKDGHDVEEPKARAGNLPEDCGRPTEMQVENNGGTHVECDGLGSNVRTISTVESINETFEGDTIESSELMPFSKGNRNENYELTENNEIPLATQQMLYACMRGVDRTRLMSLTANFDFEAERFRFARKMAVIDVKTADAGGEDPYNPNEEELVLLLHLCVDGKPAYGADIVVSYRDEMPTGGFKDLWKLRGKYKQMVA